MITLKITQKKIPLNRAAILHDLQEILKILKYEQYDLGVWFTNDATIRTYNRDYRHKDKATDVLSFPFHPELKAGERITLTTPDDANLGDLIISAEYVARDAQKLGVPFEEHLRLIVVHGICHLLGYDHIIDADFRRMRAKEVMILKKLKR